MLAHGFTQNTKCWGPFDQILASRFTIRAVDLPGHGRSQHDDADLYEAGSLLAEAGGQGVYVGYSMGGRTALHTALVAPWAVEALVLIGATAGLETDDERKKRRALDAVTATRIHTEGMTTFLERWLAQPLFATLPASQAHIEARLTNRPEGLAASLVSAGTGAMDPLWDRLAQVGAPALVIAGEEDEKFSLLGQRLADEMPNARFVAVPDAGHCVHLERPLACAELVGDFVKGLDAE